MRGNDSNTLVRAGRWILPLLVLVVSGCATLNENECMYADWYSIGLEDGTRGYGADRVGNHRKACAEYGVVPDGQRYEEGRHAGLQQYCTLINGLHVGKSGSSYRGACPGNLESEFVDGYRLGQRIYRAKSDLSSADYEIRQIEDILASEEPIEEKEEYKLQYDLRDLEREVGRLQYELELLTQEERALLF